MEDEIIFIDEPHLYRKGGRDFRGVSDIINTAYGDPFANILPKILKYAQNRGSMVHLAGLMLMEGDLDWKTVDPRIEGYVRAIEKFHRECPGKIVYMEKRWSARPLDTAAGRTW